jgi:hypothetical protein
MENVERLTNSLNHRLGNIRKIQRRLRPFDRTVRVIQLIKVSWNFPDDAFVVMNFEMNSFGEVSCADYSRTTKRRDRLWNFLLGAKP